MLRGSNGTFCFSPVLASQLLIIAQTRSGRRYSAWGDATVVQVDVDARPLLQRSIDAEITRTDSDEASPEFTPTSSRLSTPPPTPPPLSSNPLGARDQTLQTLREVSNRLREVSSTTTASGLSRKSKRNEKKRALDRAKGATKEHTLDPLLERRKTRSSVSNKYAHPTIIKASFVITALTIARYANVGVNRPTGRSVPSLAELQRAHPNFTVILNSNL